MKDIVKVTSVIIGSIIGAGFASGQEIYLFFNIYGINGILGIIIATFVTGIVIYKVFINIKDTNVNSYSEYLENMKINKKLKEIINIIINIFLLISFYIMTAGFCAYFKQEFNIPQIITAILVSVLCYMTLMKNIEGVTKTNTILIPFLICMIVFISIKNGGINIKNILENSIGMESQLIKGNWFVACLEYASYNTVILIPMLISLKEKVYKKEKIISIIVSLIFFLLAMMLYVLLLNDVNTVHNVELPLIHVVSKFGEKYRYIYGAVIVMAIYTSAIATGYSFACNCSNGKNSYKKVCVLICMSAIIISNYGFSNLVKLIYPILGLLGLIQICYILIKK